MAKIRSRTVPAPTPRRSLAPSEIRVQGAREHNLKNVNVSIPRDRLVVITGVSGSGKSSLAFDTIYAEGQRRYVESLSAYARQFLGQMEKPEVDLIEGLSPAISIEQKTTHRNPRSTVGTVTEIYDYLRLLFARVGKPHCPSCDEPVTSMTVDEIVDRVLTLPVGAKLQIMAPLVQNKKGEFADVLEGLRKAGFARIRLDGEIYHLDEPITIARSKRHTLDLVVDRLVVKEGLQSRLSEAIELALEKGEGTAIIDQNGQDSVYSRNLNCRKCNLSLPEISPQSFSFNSPQGACPSCDGLGFLLEFDEKLLVPDPELSLLEGALAPFKSRGSYWYLDQYIHELSREGGFDPALPYSRIPARDRQILLHGYPADEYEITEDTFLGIIPHLKKRYRETQSDEVRRWLERYMGEAPCTECKGRRLLKTSLGVRFQDKRIYELTEIPVLELEAFFRNVQLNAQEAKIADRVLKELKERLNFLTSIGVGYLDLARSAGSLSGGEAQRIRLATQIGSSLSGVLYILDEPSIGLHQRDNDRLLKTLTDLRDLGNTVIVVEHDEDTMRKSDYIIDLGPGAGVHGGEVVAAGTPAEIEGNAKSITGQYLSGTKQIALPTARRAGNGKVLTVKGARAHNLKNISVSFPLNKFIAVTGVSGSGKSTLVNDILYPSLANRLNKASLRPLAHGSIDGVKHLDRVISIDQEPIGRTPRSNPATYTGLFTPIRDLFAELKEAKMRGYRAGRFSFNVSGGRCENCEGAGIIKIEMHFLPDVYITCDVCKGRRYNRETLEVKWKNHSIYDILELTVEDALALFADIPAINRKLATLCEVGLDYIKLGQPATTLSGGEAQRVKLAAELSRRHTESTLYILDEPTTGLHFADIEKLLHVLHSLVDLGNTLIVIEHNLDVIKTADYIIDLGPEGGAAGGEVLATGTPEELARNAHSHTGRYLKPLLGRRKGA